MKKVLKIISLFNFFSVSMLLACNPSGSNSIEKISETPSDNQTTPKEDLATKSNPDDSLDSKKTVETKPNSENNSTTKTPTDTNPPPEEESKPKEEEPKLEVTPKPELIKDIENENDQASNPSIQYNKNQLYSVVETKLKNDTYVKVTDILEGTNPKPKDDIHLVPTQISKLPSLWTPSDIETKLITKTNNAFQVNAEIVDYTDALVYANTRTRFPNDDSKIQFTLSDGKSQFRIANYDKNNRLLTVDGTSNGSVYYAQIEYSWLKTKINVIDINKKTYSFFEKFLFLEGIGEFIEQKGNSIADNNTGGTSSKNRSISDSFQNWIDNAANDLDYIDELQSLIYKYLVLLENNVEIGYTDNLKFLTRMVHIKNTNTIESVNKLAEFSTLSKKYQDLPSELSYKPVLKRLDGSNSYLIITNSEIIIQADNINENETTKGIRWVNHGKLDDIDYYWRGEAETNNLSFKLSWIYNNNNLLTRPSRPNRRPVSFSINY